MLQAGLAGVHGNVSSFGSANGISVVALADFGKPDVGGVDGSSGATGKSSSGGSASINNDEDEIEDDDLLALLEGDEDAERSPKNTDKSDMYGKTLKTAVARVQNSGSVSGSVTARATTQAPAQQKQLHPAVLRHQPHHQRHHLRQPRRHPRQRPR